MSIRGSGNPYLLESLSCGTEVTFWTGNSVDTFAPYVFCGSGRLDDIAPTGFVITSALERQTARACGCGTQPCRVVRFDESAVSCKCPPRDAGARAHSRAFVRRLSRTARVSDALAENRAHAPPPT